MLALSLSLMLATSQVPMSAPPLVTEEAPTRLRGGARLLDAESRAALADLARREAALRPTATQTTLRVLGAVSFSLALVPVAATLVGFVGGFVVGTVAYGILGGFIGMFAGAWSVMAFIPWPLWLLAAGLGAASGALFTAAKNAGQPNARELAQIRAQRRAILHPTPMATVATF